MFDMQKKENPKVFLFLKGKHGQSENSSNRFN